MAGIAALVMASTVIDGGEKDWALDFTVYISGGIVAILSSANLFVGVK